MYIGADLSLSPFRKLTCGHELEMYLSKMLSITVIYSLAHSVNVGLFSRKV